MGSFSFTRADRTTKRANLTYGDRYKILIPKELGGGYIIDRYDDYGKINSFGDAVYVEPNGKKHELETKADLYGLLYYFNAGMDNFISHGVFTEHYPVTKPEKDFNHILDIIENGDTKGFDIRYEGIKMGCYNDQVDYLIYPLKLVSLSYKGSYEDCKGRSYYDPNQGAIKGFWDREAYRYYKERG